MNAVIVPSLEQDAAKRLVVVLTVTYQDELHFTAELSRELKERFLAGYQDMCRAAKEDKLSCIVVIKADKGASGMGRALLALWKEVAHTRGQKVIVAGYPLAYQDELDFAGLPDLPRFLLVDTKEDALKLL